jgi:nitroreductase / dihydropteridine reductase
MDFLALAQKRYTTKKYNANEKLSEDLINKLKNILQLSPSSINSQPWHFTFVSTPEVKQELADASYFNAPKVLESSYTVVFSAIDNLDKFEQQIEANLPEGAVGYYKQFIKPLPEHEVKAWLQHQVYLSLGYFLSACASLGIDSTPMEGIEKDKYKAILKLEDYQPLFAVAIGKRDANDANQPELKPKSRLLVDQIITEL